MKPNIASSVFELADYPPPAPSPPPQPFDPSTVVVKFGVPIPTHQSYKVQESPYAILLEKMVAGGMVELNDRHATSLVNAARKLKIIVARRKIGPDLYGVWRIAKT